VALPDLKAVHASYYSRTTVPLPTTVSRSDTSLLSFCCCFTATTASQWSGERRRSLTLFPLSSLIPRGPTTLPKTDTNYTALSLMPAITGNTFAASLRTDICPQREESSSTSHARNPFNLNFFDSAQCLMVRRWRLIGYFPILYNPSSRSRERFLQAPLGLGSGWLSFLS
jgi:hypothetical protein